MQPIPLDVAQFLGRTDEQTLKLAGSHLPIVTAMVRAYTRGRGVTAGGPAEDLWLIIVSSCARLTANPDMTRESSIGDFSAQQTVFNGWTLPELAVLHTYRKRAA
jgi:hypothetical protein